jgi:hypothetical protein
VLGTSLWDAHGAPKADSALPRGVGGGWGVSEALVGFVTSLAVVTWLGYDRATSGGAMSAAADAPFFRPLNNQPPSTLRHLPLAP